ncbi:hypothetical protein [Nocardiopsis chromatogenes]|uniref:hypothetical protein n=1 Tax=Nocardiopsis chromatogenes TaxID=280239 RepID=UPI000362DBB7|nr:hypothetical protein [Nocardiopsis chromatogenes]
MGAIQGSADGTAGTDGAGATGGDAGLAPAYGTGRLLGRVLRAYPRVLPAVVVASAVPLAPLALAEHVPGLLASRDGVYVNGVAEPFGGPGTAEYAWAAVLAVLGLLVVPVPLGASALIAGGALLGRPVAVRDAWRASLRRYAALAGWVLAAAAAGAALAGALLGPVLIGWPVWTGWAAAVIAGPVLLVPLAVALAVVVLQGETPWKAYATAYRMGEGRRRVHILCVAAAVGVWIGAHRGVTWLLGIWPGWGEGTPGVEALGFAVSALVGPLTVLLLCAPAVFCGQEWTLGTVVDLDLERADAALPQRAPDGAGWKAMPVPALAAVLVLPPLVGPALFLANPFGAPVVVQERFGSVRSDEYAVDVLPKGETATLLFGADGADAAVCDPECAWVDSGERLARGGGTTLAATGDGYALVSWRDFTYQEEPPGPNEKSGLYAAACDEPAECGAGGGRLVRPFAGDHYDTASDAVRVGDGLVVASSVRADGFRADPDGEEGGLLIQICADTACTGPRDVPVPGVGVGGFLVDGRFLDIAAAPDGGFAVAAFDAAFGELNVVHCADDECAEPQVTQVREAEFREEFEGGVRARYGVRALYRPDGTPVLAYRDPASGEAHVVDCADAACSESTDRAVTGPGWERPAPGMALDSEGRPQLATFDMAAGRLVLVSCRDTGCADTATVPLAEVEGEPGKSAIALDEQDRPHIVWAQGETDADFGTRRFDGDLVSTRCEEALCGAGGQTP